MKKFAIGAVALLLLLSLVGCGTFSYNINSYLTLADYNDEKVVFIDKEKVDKAVKEALDNLIDSYPEIKDKTSGEVKDGDTVYIYYEGTLVLFNGETTIKVDSDEVKAVVGFNEALKKAEFKDGVAEFEITLDKAFTIPAFAKKPAKEEDKKDEDKKDETSEKAEEKAAEPEPAAETSKEETSKSESSTTTETSYFASKKTKVIITVEGKSGKVADGEELKCTLRWIHPEFEGGTYNKATEDKAKEEAAKKEEESKTSASASASTSEKEEEKKAGYQLKIGSDSFIDGFEDGLIGLSVATNTKKTLSLTFPNPYTSNKALSGVDVEFDVTILSVTEEIKRDPETQWDELKHDIVEENEDAAFDFKNVGEYKAFVEEAKKMDLVATKMLYGSTMKKFPASDYKEYKQNYENYLYQQMFMQYFYTTYSTSAPELSTLVTKYGGFKSLDAYYQHIADQAALNLKRDLALYQVAKKEGLTKVTAEDIEEYINYSNTLSGTKTLTTENFNESFGGKDEANKTVVIYKAQKFLAEKAPVVTVK